MRLRARLLSVLPAVSTSLYLRVSPRECYRRVHEVRRREYESSVTLEYLAGLDARYGELAEEALTRFAVVDWEHFGEAEAVLAEHVAELDDESCARVHAFEATARDSLDEALEQTHEAATMAAARAAERSLHHQS